MQRHDRRHTDSSIEKARTQKKKNENRHEESNIAPGERFSKQVEAEPKELDMPPDGGYGWVVVACVCMINAHTWGLNAAYGVFLAHYLSEGGLFPDAGPLEYAFVGGLSISQALMISPIVGLATKHLGITATLLIGVFLETAAFVGASFATQIWHVFLSQGICFGWGMGFLFVGSAGITAQWFTARRSLANGIAASGAGLGGVVYSLAAQAIIDSISLAWAFRILAIAAFTANAVSAILIKDRNKHIGTQMSFDYRIFKRWEFIGFLLFGILSELAYVVLLFSLPNYSTTIGLTHEQGSIIGALFNLGLALGRPIIGYYSDSIGRLNMASAMTCLSGVFCLLVWMFAQTFGVLALFSILGGAVGGTFWAVVAPVTTEVVGLVDLSAALSCTWLVLVLPTTFSEPIGLELVKYNNDNYVGTILFAGFMYIGGAGFILLVRAWKIGQLAEEAFANTKRVRGTDTPLSAHEKSSFVRRFFMWSRV